MAASRAAVRSLVPDMIGVAIVGSLLAVGAHSFTFVRVDGASMRPALEVGDVVIVERADDVRSGDIVMFRLQGDTTPTLHRAVESSGAVIFTRGDANPIRDRRSVSRHDTLGRVRWVLPFGVLAKRFAG